MYVLVIISALLPLSTAFVNCKIACQRCSRSEGVDHQILEVYCAMCKECKDRRRERMKTSEALDSLLNKTMGHQSEQREPVKLAHNRHKAAKRQDEESDDCPTPPPCESSNEEYVPIKLTATSPPTTTTPTTTTRRPTPCPVVENTCRRKKKTTPQACVPCMPMCMTPCVPASPVPARATAASPTTNGFYYVYVGVPKNLISHK